jgi:hypothetical protein
MICSGLKPSQLWNEWVNCHPEWGNVPDAAFIASVVFNTQVRPTSRKRKRLINGKSVPGPPSQAKQNEYVAFLTNLFFFLTFFSSLLRKKAIGDWDKPISPKPIEILDDLAIKFEQGYFPIGDIIRTRIHEDLPATYSSRWLNIGVALTFLLVLAHRYDTTRFNHIPLIFDEHFL